jgi:hypothetical protein
MKKALLTIAIGAGLLVACTTKETVYVPQTTNPSVIKTTTTESVSWDSLYLVTIRDAFPELGTFSDSYLITLGQTICDSIDEGMTIVDLALIAIDLEIDEYLLGYIGGAAITAYCPWNDWFFQQN